MNTPIMTSDNSFAEIGESMADSGAPVSTAVPELPSDDGIKAPTIEEKAPETPSIPPEATKPPEVKEPSVAAKFSAIAKKEKALLDRERAFKDKEVAFNAYEKLKADVKADPIKYLESIGLSYADITDYIINSSSSPEVTKVKELETKLEAFRKEQEDAKKAEQSRVVEQATTNYKKSIADHIEKNNDKFESLALDTKESTELVFQVISQYWEETGGMNGGKQLDFDTACDYVEKQLEKELEEKAERLAKTKKYGSKFAKAEVKDAPKASAAPLISSMPDTITTKSHTASTGSVPPKRVISDEESLELASKLLQWGK